METYSPLFVISICAAGTDQESYEEVIIALTGYLQDTHVLVGAVVAKYFGPYSFPVPLEEAEGKLVVTESVEGYPFAAGDVLIALNGESIDDIAEAAKKYFSITRDEVFLKHAMYLITSSKTEDVEVTILRGAQQMTFSVKETLETTFSYKEKKPPYEILDGNIGLINPGNIFDMNTVYEAMRAVRDTNSLIIDLRQYPGGDTFIGNPFLQFYNYLPSTYQECMIFARPVPAAPGSYIKRSFSYGYNPSLLSDSEIFYPWEKPVAVLMDKTTWSFSEMGVTVFGMDDNVVVLGENSIGSNGHVAYLPLPGEIEVSFSSVGCYEMDGTQTQRTGITPDIPVSRTIEGIAAGRDEQMEAAVQYLIDNR